MPLPHIAIAVVEHENRFLVGERPAGVDLAGYAEFPGGKVHDGETAEQAAVRECLEETGVAVRIVGELSTVTHGYPHGLLTLHFFAAAPLDPAASPRSPFRWVVRPNLAELRFPPANDDLLRQLMKPKVS